MDLNEFSRAAGEAWEAIPAGFKKGIDGLAIRAEANRSPDGGGSYILGECATEHYPSGFEGPDTVRSLVVLYHGSFAALSGADPGFNWQHEIWETLTHELRHHLEALAGEHTLEGVDHAVDHDIRRAEGREFDPWYYQHAEEVEPGVFVAEDLVFLELEWHGGDAPEAARFELEGSTFEVPLPQSIGDVHYLTVEGLPQSAPNIDLVIVRREPSFLKLGRMLRSATVSVTESRATVVTR